MEKIGNFSVAYLESTFGVEGYHDIFNWSTDDLKSKTSTLSRRRAQGQATGSKRIYDFVFVPNSGFLNSNLPLLNNCELKLSFDRLNMEHAMVEAGDTAVTNDMTGAPLVIKDCEAITEYIMSEALEKYFMKIDTAPIPYYYQECDVTIKSLPKEESIIRFDNIKGGPVPIYIFAGLIPSEYLMGDINHSCTTFDAVNVTDFDITLNGNSVNGYPLHNPNVSPVYPLYKFLDATSRYMNPDCGETMRLGMFMHNWIYAHKFEGESSDRGWLGINLKLETGLSDSYSLVMWTIYDCALTIDKFHQIEKLNL